MDVKDIYVLLTANTDQFKAKMAEAAGESDGLSGTLMGVGKAAVAAFLVAGAAAAGFLVDAAKQGEEYNVALAGMEQAQKKAAQDAPAEAPAETTAAQPAEEKPPVIQTIEAHTIGIIFQILQGDAWAKVLLYSIDNKH